MRQRVLRKQESFVTKKEWNGYNSKELAEKYNLTTKQIGNILKDEPMIGQMSIFDMNNDD